MGKGAVDGGEWVTHVFRPQGARGNACVSPLRDATALPPTSLHPPPPRFPSPTPSGELIPGRGLSTLPDMAVAVPPDPAAWLGLLLTPGLGLRGMHGLIATFGGAEAALAAPLTELEGCGLRPEIAQHIADGRSLALGEEEFARTRDAGITVLTLHQREYPVRLREIYDPPPVLYVRGAVAALDTFGIAVVGTRHPTQYGRLMAERLSRDLAAWGLTVFSGLARGIDGESHKGCLEAGGLTIAVFGTGLDIIYPREHGKLAARILAQGGAWVTEFPLTASPTPQNFPIRNRIISGLALGVLIIEGGEFSGSRVTARMALEQNREVFGVPGTVVNKQAWLPNTLIKQGAKLVSAVADILEELPTTVRQRLNAPPAAAEELAGNPAGNRGDAPQPAPLPAAQSVLRALRADEATHVDTLAERLDFSTPALLALLFELELAGRVRQLPGMHFVTVSA